MNFTSSASSIPKNNNDTKVIRANGKNRRASLFWLAGSLEKVQGCDFSSSKNSRSEAFAESALGDGPPGSQTSFKNTLPNLCVPSCR